MNFNQLIIIGETTEDGTCALASNFRQRVSEPIYSFALLYFSEADDLEFTKLMPFFPLPSDPSKGALYYEFCNSPSGLPDTLDRSKQTILILPSEQAVFTSLPLSLC